MSENIKSGHLPNFSQRFGASAWRGRRKWVLVFGLALFVCILFQPNVHQWIFGPPAKPVDKINMRLNCISSDNRLLSFDFCRNDKCFPGLLNLHSLEVTKIVPSDPDEWWSSGHFSPDDKSIAFAVKRKSENSRLSQLGLYDISTGTLKILTRTQSFKEYPSFSPGGTRLIYTQANRERTSGRTRFSDWDIYEMDIETGHERQLTDYQFFLIGGSPYYMPDGKQFIFSGEAPNRFGGKIGIDAYKIYQKVYQDNTIFILGPEDPELRPAFTNGPLTNGPIVSNDGKRIVYRGRSDNLNRAAGDTTPGGYTFDVFMLENGQHHRLTNLKQSLLDYTMSPDGNWVAYASGRPREGEEVRLWLLDIDKGQTKQIDITIDTLFKN